jgi:hypothetical protein
MTYNKPLSGKRLKKKETSYAVEEWNKLQKRMAEAVECNKLPKNKKGKPYRTKARAMFYLTERRRSGEHI